MRSLIPVIVKSAKGRKERGKSFYYLKQVVSFLQVALLQLLIDRSHLLHRLHPEFLVAYELSNCLLPCLTGIAEEWIRCQYLFGCLGLSLSLARYGVG